MGPTPFPMWDSIDAAILTTRILPDTLLQAIVIKDWIQRDSDESNVHFEKTALLSLH